MTRANEQAFPTPWHNDSDLNVSAPNGEVVAPGCSVQLLGLTKREYFAAMAMQGLLASGANEPHANYEWCANRSIAMADALLAALSGGRHG